MPTHKFIGDFCIFCGAEDDSAPCKIPVTLTEHILYAVKNWLAEDGWTAPDATRWHELTTHVAGLVYLAMEAVDNGADEVTFIWPGGAYTYYIEQFQITGVLSGILKHVAPRKITIEIVPHEKIKLEWLIATILHQESRPLKNNRPVTLTAEAIAKYLRSPDVLNVSS